VSLLTSFQNAPIKRKLMLISLLTSGFALLYITLILATSGWVDKRAEAVSNWTTYARVIGANATSAMLFDDADAATKTLATLAASPDIADAVIYDKAGKMFARYLAPQHDPGAFNSPVKPGAHLLDTHWLVLSEPIEFKGKALGSIYLEVDLRDMYADILSDAGLVFLVVLSAFLASLFLLTKLQKTIVAPIQELANGMQAVSTDQNYAVRVAVHGNDEVGRLADIFNIMLARIQERTQQLLDAQEELVRKEKLAVLGQVAGSVGHELRNPLGVMSNAVYFLQTVLPDADETVKEYLDIIKNEIAGSERIVSDLLDSVRTKPPHPEMVGVAELIGQTLRKVSVPAPVTVKLDIPATLPPLRVDAMQIGQVLRNLISNGVEAMPEGGVLEISAVENKPDGTITVSVRDSGIGMTPEQLGHLFQPLFTTKARGIGLGLVVVKNLTEANGGTVEVESEAGKGTMFTVTLSAADERGISI